MTTLYKKDTKDKIRYLTTWTVANTLFQESGVVDTDKPVVHSKNCTPKNVGRTNETTPEAQAIFEMNSLIAEKLKEGYFRTQAEAETGEVILPMLAKSYKDEAKKVDWNNAYVQPKLDGMRALGDQVLISRKGTIIETVPHLTPVISQIPIHLDGELYAHGIGFQENMRLTKKYRPGESEVIKYYVYDCVGDAPFTVRLHNLRQAIEGYKDIHKSFIQLVPTHKVTSEKELQSWHARFLSEGYEGTMLRWGNEPYKVNGRSSNLLKYKDFLDLACKIVDIEPAEQRPSWAVPVFELNGNRFRAGMKFSHAEREEFLLNKDKYIGQIAELRFFEYSEDGIPRFPVMVGIRNDKTQQDENNQSS